MAETCAGSKVNECAIMGTENGWSDPFCRLAVLQPLYMSMIRSLISREDPDLAIGGSSIANGSVEIAALSKKDPLAYIADD